MSFPTIQTAFAAGELAPSLFGHVDLQKYAIGLSTCRNAYINYRGGAWSRAGTAFVTRSKQVAGSQSPPRLITYQYSISQGYVLELGDQYIRFMSNGAPILEAPQSITAITNAIPGVLTVAAHGYANGDWVTILGATGLTKLNGGTYIVDNALTNTFTLTDLNGNAVSTAGAGTYTGGGTVARVLTLATPYAATDLPLLKFAQSADVMSFTHQLYPPYDLRRITNNSWTMTAVTFDSTVFPPASVSVVATVQPSSSTTPPTLPAAYSYQITSVSSAGQESVASPRGDVTDSVDISVTAGSLIITWPSAASAQTYNIYKAPTSYNTDPGNTADAIPPPVGSVYGFIGQSYGLQFVDSNIVPDLQQTPPLHIDPFSPSQVLAITITAPGSYSAAPTVAITTGTGVDFSGEVVLVGTAVEAVIITDNGHGYLPGDAVAFSGGSGSGATATLTIGPASGTYPGVVSYFSQRRVYASTLNNPDTYFMSKPGQFTDFSKSTVPLDTDAITGTPWAQQVNGIQWMLPMPGGLVTFTGLGAWLVNGGGGSATNPVAITPTSQQATPQAFTGCSSILMPITINFDILYVPAINTYVRDLSYNYWVNIYTGTDITALSSHLFTSFQLTQWAWAQEPFKLVWAVRNDGTALSLTYLKEQEVAGWARHDTNGQFLSVCAVIEPPVYAPYFVVARYPNDGTPGHFYIERMDNRDWNTAEDPWCIDSGLALPMPAPNVGLSMSAASGSGVDALATGAVFSIPGQVLRSGGGIGVVTTVVSSTHAKVNILSPITQVIPDGNNTPIFQQAGAWTLTTPVMTVTGLTHLAGLTVTGLADGIPIPPQAVNGSGVITLAVPASNIKVGLGFTAQVQSLYLNQPANPTMQGRRKSITAMTARVDSSLMIAAGTDQVDGSTLTPMQIAPTWTVQNVPDLGGTYTSPGGQTVQLPYTGDLRLNTAANWAKAGQVAVQQSFPVPLQLLALIPETLQGDLPEEGISDKGQKAEQPPQLWGPPQGNGLPKGDGPWIRR